MTDQLTNNWDTSISSSQQYNNRNINIDIIKCLAVFFVICVHFFLNNHFYQTPVNGIRMHIMCGMRTFFMMCVPLFLIITGFLMHKKELSLKYYKGLYKIIIPYIIISIITWIIKQYCVSYGIFQETTLTQDIFDLFRFKLIGYAWYVGMYIGLFLLIPFLNKMIPSDKKGHLILILTLLSLTLIPVLITDFKQLWPITYYVIGAYFARYQVKLNTFKIFILFICFMSCFIILNLFLTHGHYWNVYKIDDWGSFENTITSTLFFLLLLKINFNNMSNKIKNIISGIAKLSLGIYLSSYVFDKIIYHYFNQYIYNLPNKLTYFCIVVPIIFCCSILLAKISNLIETQITNKLIVGKAKI